MVITVTIVRTIITVTIVTRRTRRGTDRMVTRGRTNQRVCQLKSVPNKKPCQVGEGGPGTMSHPREPDRAKPRYARSMRGSFLSDLKLW